MRGYNNWNMAATSEIISDQSSTSKGYEVLEENECNILDSYEQQDIADGLQVCNQILERLQIIKGPASKSFSSKALALGERFATVLIETLKEWEFYEEELFLPEENIPEEDVKVEQTTSSFPSPEKISATTSSTSTLQNTEESEDDFEPASKKSKADYISLDTKIKILNMARQHPKWSLQTIQKKTVVEHLKLKNS